MKWFDIKYVMPYYPLPNEEGKVEFLVSFLFVLHYKKNHYIPTTDSLSMPLYGRSQITMKYFSSPMFIRKRC